MSPSPTSWNHAELNIRYKSGHYYENSIYELFKISVEYRITPFQNQSLTMILCLISGSVLKILKIKCKNFAVTLKPNLALTLLGHSTFCKKNNITGFTVKPTWNMFTRDTYMFTCTLGINITHDLVLF